ncbi:MAG: SDR family NAD(P)-dependent oxidoreductase [Candidatus Binataceae bacterium]
MPQADRSSGPAQTGWFAGRNVVVTGASSGIGRDIAQTFAGYGASVAILARREQMLVDLADQIGRAGGKALPIVCDVTREGDVRDAIARANREHGPLDILVNNAGVSIPGKTLEMRGDDLHQMMDVNFYGTVYATQAALPVMLEAGRGNIVNIASLAGRRGMSPLGGYCATKFAVVGFTEALRMELFGTGISASLVMPGVVDTPMVREFQRQAIPAGFAMPARWVTWAVLAAVTMGLAEVDVPFGAATAEKLASLFPEMTGALLGMGARVFEYISTLAGRNAR